MRTAARPGPPISGRRRWAERVASLCVRVGGFAVVTGILGILAFLIAEVFPVLLASHVETEKQWSTTVTAPVLAVLTDEHRTHTATLAADGYLRIYRKGAEAPVMEEPIGDGRRIVSAKSVLGDTGFAVLAADGRIAWIPLEFSISFVEQTRVVQPEVSAPVWIATDQPAEDIEAFSVRHDATSTAAIFSTKDHHLAWIRISVEENMFTGEQAESVDRFDTQVSAAITEILIDREQRNVFAGATNGELFWWEVEGGALDQHATYRASEHAVTAMSMLIGDRSIVIGQADGSISVWFRVPQADGQIELQRIRDFPAHGSAIGLITPSERDRSFFALSNETMGLYYSTSSRTLWTGSPLLKGTTALSYAPKGDGVVFAGGGAVGLAHVENPHPEITLASLFGRVWYEDHAEPMWVWQSTGGTDEFEPKLGLTPLMLGTLKGTIYSLIIAIPLGILGALYTSQFVHPRMQSVIKPAVEIMASLPSVVLGFLAGLWLAPLLEKNFPMLVLMFLIHPPLILMSGWLWHALPKRFTARMVPGTELLLYGMIMAVGFALAFALAEPFEAQMFAGDFSRWLYESSGLRYDQRNAVVVGIAMGFAVIPIIFSIAEDAFSNVPKNLAAASLALGASRWETVVRVVLPTASAGIFSAIMIGLGRAVGETMIVLMATGNTPILDWSAFNGFRTLSANIAVEIPEAPHAGTLYRVLFISALLLFLLTFLINTVAEIVRQRLRQRFARL